MKDIDTSIVLATCSRAHMLRGALSSLLAEAERCDKPVEIVVVDDGSTDNTADVLAECQHASAVPVAVVSGARQGVAAARNLAAEYARGAWLASFDDDQIALPGWLAALRKVADAEGLVCVGGSLELDLPPGRMINEFGPRARRILGENLCPAAKSRYRPASNNVLIRKDVFQTLGGYDCTFTEGAEDADFFDRVADAGYELRFQPDARGLHVTPQSRIALSNFRWTSLRIGASDTRRLMTRGRAKLLVTAMARALTLVLRDIPLLAWCGITRNRKSRLDVLCSLWYSVGLLRALPAFLSGRQRESAFLRSLDFRVRNGERHDATARAQ